MPHIQRQMVSTVLMAFMALLGVARPAHALVLAGSAEFTVSYSGEIDADPGVPIPATPLLGSGAFRFIGEDLLDFEFEFLGEMFNDADFQCGGCDPADKEGRFSFDIDYGAGRLAWRFEDGNCAFSFDIGGLRGSGTCDDGNVGMPFSNSDFRLVPEPSGLTMLGLLLLLLATAPLRSGHRHR